MDWLGNILGQLLGVFSPLKNIQHWKIWAELKSWYDRFKKWRDWYRDHILAPFKAEQQALRKIQDTFITPVIRLIDHIRQLTGVIALFNKKLADKLNYQFLRVESYLLQPFNQALSRLNVFSGIVQSILTPLGFLDRALLLNSVWRDAGLIKEILHNPFEQHPAAATLPPAPTIADNVSATKQYLASHTGPYAADVDAAVLQFKALQASQ